MSARLELCWLLAPSQVSSALWVGRLILLAFAQVILQLKAVNCSALRHSAPGARGWVKESEKIPKLGFVSVGCGAQPGKGLKG